MLLEVAQRINNYPGEQGVVDDSLVNLIIGNIQYAVEFPHESVILAEDSKKLRQALLALIHYNQFTVTSTETNIITLTNISGISNLFDGMLVTFIPSYNNIAGGVTLKINLAESKPIVKPVENEDGSITYAQLDENELTPNTMVTVKFVEDLNSFVLVSSGGVSSDVSAVVEYIGDILDVNINVETLQDDDILIREGDYFVNKPISDYVAEDDTVDGGTY